MSKKSYSSKMKTTVSLLFLIIVTLTFENSNCNCLNRISLDCKKVPQKSNDFIQHHSSELDFDCPARRNAIIITSPKLQRSLKYYNNRKSKSKKLCSRYECRIKNCKKTCTNINTSGPTDFKLIDSFTISSDENDNPTPDFVEFDENFQPSQCHYDEPHPQHYYDEINDSIRSFDEFEKPQHHYDEINDSIPSFDEFEEPQHHYDEINDSIPSFDEFEEPQHHYDEINDSIQSFDENDEPQNLYYVINDSIPSFDEYAESW
ncbi:uncharacterized protein LOC127277691 isoform X3 [Leptopilina boulardi]|uniref:uncharacterized protein LOC127277691 isoform X2 n=1 Tax=Leptopilina boulardi TaxID=63433 RepID=UPI0021F69AA6|nr:uncharacterized protein LOC127277691 isoform X2 [Leptopilina boulardi]XP_051154950.1 uncharacterized protein LOC127277691 isoform X3 [Leptopilina boulardi]